MRTLIKPVLLILLSLTVLSSCGGEEKPDEPEYLVICRQMGATPEYVDKYMKDNIKNLETDSEDAEFIPTECAEYVKNYYYYSDESYEGFGGQWSYMFTEKGLVQSAVAIEDASQFDPAKFKDFSDFNLKVSKQEGGVTVKGYWNDEETLQLLYMQEEFDGESAAVLIYYDLEFIRCVNGGGPTFPFEVVNEMRGMLRK